MDGFLSVSTVQQSVAFDLEARMRDKTEMMKGTYCLLLRRGLATRSGGIKPKAACPRTLGHGHGDFNVKVQVFLGL